MATKIVTKNSSTASAVPTASDLVQGELAVNVADKRLFTEDNAGAIVELGTNPSGNVTFQDNGKAIFGAGSDLQIYHDGSNSYIADYGTGDLKIRSNKIRMEAPDSQNMIIVTEDAGVQAFYNGTERLSVNNTGIDVTGTATMDGLTSSGNLTFDAVAINKINSNGFLYYDIPTGYTHTFTEAGNTKKLLDLTSGGDIRFYEDTGTTPKLFWDASAESLGIGGAATDATFQVKGTGVNTGIPNVLIDASFADASNGTGLTIGHRTDETTAVIAPRTATGNLAFYNYNGGWSESVRIDSAGNVGINNSAPYSPLSVTTTGTLPQDKLWYEQVNMLTLNGTRPRAGLSTAATTGGNLYDGDMLFYNMYYAGGADYQWKERMRITSAGNVGIGTSNPDTSLHVTTPSGTKTELNLSQTAVTNYRLSIPASTDALTFVYGANIERMRIDSAGHAIIPNGVTLGTAVGVYNAANTLDDYEEGTWTPVVTDGTNNATMYTSAGNGGTYTKIGRVVTFTAQVTVETIGSVGANAYISGLPFTNGSAGANRATAAIGYGSSLSITAGRALTAYVELNQQNIYLKQWDATTGTSGVAGSEITNGGTVFMSGAYFTA